MAELLNELMNSSFWIDVISLEWSIVYFKGSQVSISNKICSLFPEDHFILASSVDPDEMSHYAVFNLDLLCLQL